MNNEDKNKHTKKAIEELAKNPKISSSLFSAHDTNNVKFAKQREEK
jgi:hypothetical protein